jgi:hypothetical protein
MYHSKQYVIISKSVASRNSGVSTKISRWRRSYQQYHQQYWLFSQWLTYLSINEMKTAAERASRRKREISIVRHRKRKAWRRGMAKIGGGGGGGEMARRRRRRISA